MTSEGVCAELGSRVDDFEALGVRVEFLTAAGADYDVLLVQRLDTRRWALRLAGDQAFERLVTGMDLAWGALLAQDETQWWVHVPVDDERDTSNTPMQRYMAWESDTEEEENEDG